MYTVMTDEMTQLQWTPVVTHVFGLSPHHARCLDGTMQIVPFEQSSTSAWVPSTFL